MVINLKNDIPKYQYGIFHLLKMIFPYDTVVQNQETADVNVTFTLNQSTVTVFFGEHAHTEPIIRDDILLSLKRAVYKVTGSDLPFGVLTGVRPSKTALKFEDDIVKNLEEVYFVSPQKGSVMEHCAKKVISVTDRLTPGQLSLYINIPFCPSRCRYCSFTLGYLKPYPMLIDSYLSALLCELKAMLQTVAQCNLQLNSIYIGGGTPTVLNEIQLGELMDTIVNHTNLPGEFTVEAGRADTITKEKLQVLKDSGVSRISINPQTLNQKTLELIGRRHSVEEFYHAYEWSRQIGFETVNTDLIAGLAEETFLDFKNSLDGILQLAPEHITVHTLCKKRTSNLVEPMEEETAKEVVKMLDYTYRVMEGEYEPYYIYRQKNAISSLENIGFMRNQKECAYNIFMMEEASSVLAVGAGGTSKLVDYQTKSPFSKLRTDKQPERYIRDLSEGIKKKQQFLLEGMNLI